MKVCDRHPRTQATDSITLQSTDEHFDLCKDCSAAITEYMKTARHESVEKAEKGFWRKKIPA